MSDPSLCKSSPILIIGAGVFGLSTAIHLAQRGYTNVTIFDKQEYESTRYSYAEGCDAASADLNKVIRVAYGPQTDYQSLALSSNAQWRAWNQEIKYGKSRDLPPGFTADDILFVNNGSLELTSDPLPTQYALESIANMKAAGYTDTQLNLKDPISARKAVEKGLGFAVNPFNRPLDESSYALLDTMGGFLHADRVCQFVLHKAKSLGVQMVLGGLKATFDSLIYNESNGDAKVVEGVKMADGTVRDAKLVIMACGGWTPSLLPQMDNLCETTGGSVSMFQLPGPPDSPLWKRFSPERFPTWAYNIMRGAQGGLYGFPRTPNGVVKIGYRGTKYTNPQVQPDGAVRSVPITRWTSDSIRSLPQTAADVIRRFVADFIPELASCEVKTRLCWYTDSFDNHFVMDFVPGVQGVMVASGGSGHGFHFTPMLGKYVVDRIEGKEGALLQKWKWRSQNGTPANHIMEGMKGSRALQSQKLTREDSLQSRTDSK